MWSKLRRREERGNTAPSTSCGLMLVDVSAPAPTSVAFIFIEGARGSIALPLPVLSRSRGMKVRGIGDLFLQPPSPLRTPDGGPEAPPAGHVQRHTPPSVRLHLVRPDGQTTHRVGGGQSPHPYPREPAGLGSGCQTLPTPAGHTWQDPRRSSFQEPQSPSSRSRLGHHRRRSHSFVAERRRRSRSRSRRFRPCRRQGPLQPPQTEGICSRGRVSLQHSRRATTATAPGLASTFW